MTLLSCLCILGFLQLSWQLALKRDDNSTIDMDCDPAIVKRPDVCPHGYCCVRDEFLPTYVYCKKMGLDLESCTTRDTESACPCIHGLQCVPNIHGGGFSSLYGTCKPVASPVVG